MFLFALLAMLLCLNYSVNSSSSGLDDLEASKTVLEVESSGIWSSGPLRGGVSQVQWIEAPEFISRLFDTPDTLGFLAVDVFITNTARFSSASFYHKKVLLAIEESDAVYFGLRPSAIMRDDTLQVEPALGAPVIRLKPKDACTVRLIFLVSHNQSSSLTFYFEDGSQSNPFDLNALFPEIFEEPIVKARKQQLSLDS